MTPEIVGQFLARVRRKIGDVNFLKSGFEKRNSEFGKRKFVSRRFFWTESRMALTILPSA